MGTSSREDPKNKSYRAENSQTLNELKSSIKDSRYNDRSRTPSGDYESMTGQEANELFLYATKPAYRVPATGQELSEFDKSFMELKKDPKKFIKLVKLVKNGLEIKDAVKVQ